MSPVEALQLDLERTERVLRDERARADRAVEDRRQLEARVKALREGLQELRREALLMHPDHWRGAIAGKIGGLIDRDSALVESTLHTTHE
jgi:hypothetical protein